MRNEMKERLLSWSDYIFIGMALAVMMSARDEYRDGFCQMILVVAFFVFSGFENNLKLLTQFIKRFPFYAALTVVWTVYFGVLNRGEYISYRYAITVFFIVFAGYAISDLSIETIKEGMEKLWMLIAALLLTGLVNYIIVHDFKSRLHLFFLHAIPESDTAILFALISLFFIGDRFKKLIGITVSFLVVILSASKSTIAELVFLLVVYTVLKRNIILDLFKKSGLTSRVKGIVAALGIALLCIGLFASNSKVEIDSFDKIGTRVNKAMESLTKDCYLDYYGAHSVRNRIASADQIMDVIREHSASELLLGGGMLSGYYSLRPIAKILTSSKGASAGPVENAFLSHYSDYGLLAFVLYLAVFISSIYCGVITKNYNLRIHAISVVMVMAHGLFGDMQYWMSIAFPVLLFIGMYLNELYKAGEQKLIYAPMLFAGVLGVALLVFEHLHSVIRTTISSFALHKGWLILLVVILVLAVLVFLWESCVFVTGFLCEKTIQKRRLAYVGASLGMAGVIVGVCFFQDSRVFSTVIDRIDSEKAVIAAMKNGAVGDIYNDTFPLFYDARIGGIKGTLFSGASLGATRDVTVIVDRTEEAQRMLDMGFLYTPISEQDAVYTNDQGVISTLKDLGYNPKGYYTERTIVDFTGNTDENILKQDDGGIEIGSIDRPVVIGSVDAFYPGEKSAAFKLKINNNSEKEENDYKVCTLIIKERYSDKKAISAVVMREMFDENGELLIELPFSLSGADYDFLVDKNVNEKLIIDEISYIRTPKYDVHVIVNDQGKVISKEYFDLDGNHLDIADD